MEVYKNMKPFAIIGSILALLGVAIGAFGAHGLEDKISEDMLANYQTGAQYQMYHALGLLLIGLIADKLSSSKLIRAAGWLLTVGVVIFSGSLYILSISGNKTFGAITPIGGVCFIIGWACLAIAIWKQAKPSTNN